MDKNILSTLKGMLGIPEDDNSFDMDILVHANTILEITKQLGVTSNANTIDDITEWSIFPNEVNLLQIKTLFFLKCRLYFDPPQTSFALESLNNLVSELEWRLNDQVEIENAR